CHEIRGDLGIEVPVPDIYLDRAMPANRFVIELEGVPVSEGELPADCLLLKDDPVHAHLLEIPALEADSPLSRRTAQWIELQHQDSLQEADVGFLFADEVLRAVVDRTLRRYAADFLGIQETRAILERMEASY